MLITGGAGFIGRKLTEKLTRAGHSVTLLDNLSPQIHGDVPRDLEWIDAPEIRFVRGSITQRADWEKALENIDTIVHLAAETGTGQSMYEVSRYYEVNVSGTALLFDILMQRGRGSVSNIILASSRSVYGEGRYKCNGCGLDPVYPDSRSAEQLKRHDWEFSCPDCGTHLSVQPTRESDRLFPASYYAATKAAQEQLVQTGAAALGLGYTIFRFQNVYGEGQSLKNPYTGILSIFSTKIRRGLTLPVFEDGKESRDFVHVDDVVGGVEAAVMSKKPVNCILNIGSGKQVSILEAANALSRVFGRVPDTLLTNQYRIGDIRHNVADVSRLKAVLDFEPTVSLDEGLERFARWVETQTLPEDNIDKANAELKAKNLLG